MGLETVLKGFGTSNRYALACNNKPVQSIADLMSGFSLSENLRSLWFELFIADAEFIPTIAH